MASPSAQSLAQPSVGTPPAQIQAPHLKRNRGSSSSCFRTFASRASAWYGEPPSSSLAAKSASLMLCRSATIWSRLPARANTACSVSFRSCRAWASLPTATPKTLILRLQHPLKHPRRLKEVGGSAEPTIFKNDKHVLDISIISCNLLMYACIACNRYSIII